MGILVAIGAREAENGGFHLFDDHVVIFDDRIRKQVAADLVESSLVELPVGLQFDDFADAHGLHSGESVVTDGIAHGDALRVEDARFRHDDDFCFHLGKEAQPAVPEEGDQEEQAVPQPSSGEKKKCKRLDTLHCLSLKTRMLPRTRNFLTGVALAGLSAWSLAGDPPLTPEQLKGADRTDDFSIPTPGEFMAALNKIGKPDWSSKTGRSVPTSIPSRAQQALNLGTLIADGYVAVEAESKQEVRNVGRDIVEMAKPLGVREEIINRGKSLTEFAENGQWDVLREELEATQNEVKTKFAESADKDLITLITVGGWIRGTEVVAALVSSKYTEAGAKLLRQPGIVDFLAAKLDALPEKLRDDPAVKRCRVKLGELKAAVSFSPDAPPDKAAVEKIHKIAADLVKELTNKKLQ